MLQTVSKQNARKGAQLLDVENVVVVVAKPYEHDQIQIERDEYLCRKAKK